MILKISDKEYHARTELSSSLLRKFLISPAHYVHAVMNPEEPTAAMELGTLAHKAILEPALLESMNVVDVTDKRSKAWKDAPEGSITMSEYAQVQRLMVAAVSHPEGELIQNATHEETVIFELHSVPCRARFDAVDWEAGIIWDVKTTSESTPDGFERAIFGPYKYYIQAAFYALAFRSIKGYLPRFRFLAIGKGLPHWASSFELSQSVMDVGIHTILAAMGDFKNCRDSQTFPGFSTETKTVELPMWFNGVNL